MSRGKNIQGGVHLQNQVNANANVSAIRCLQLASPLHTHTRAHKKKTYLPLEFFYNTGLNSFGKLNLSKL